MITENDAIIQAVNSIREFKRNHGTDALYDAIAHGAFHSHPDFGDLLFAFRDQEYEHDAIHIPDWICQMYSEITEDVVSY